MAAGFAEHVLHQFGRAIGDLGLVGEIGRRIDEHAELDDPLDPLEIAERRLDLRQQHDAAAPGGGDPAVEVHVLAEPAFDQAAVLGEADLARDVEQPAELDRRDIGRDRGRGLGQGDADFGEALFDASCAPPKHRAARGIKPRDGS